MGLREKACQLRNASQSTLQCIRPCVLWFGISGHKVNDAGEGRYLLLYEARLVRDFFSQRKGGFLEESFEEHIVFHMEDVAEHDGIVSSLVSEEEDVYGRLHLSGREIA